MYITLYVIYYIMLKIGNRKEVIIKNRIKYLINIIVLL